MKQFEVRVDNRKGALADVTDVLSKSRVNIRAVASEIRGPGAVIKFIVDDEDTTKSVLLAAGLDFSVYEIVPVSLINRPGELSKIARAMTNIGLDIESLFILGIKDNMTELAFKVDDFGEARKLVKELGVSSE